MFRNVVRREVLQKIHVLQFGIHDEAWGERFRCCGWIRLPGKQNPELLQRCLSSDSLKHFSAASCTLIGVLVGF